MLLSTTIGPLDSSLLIFLWVTYFPSIADILKILPLEDVKYKLLDYFKYY